MSSNSARCYNRGLMRKVLIGLLLVFTASGLVTAQRGQPQQRPPVAAVAPAASNRTDDQTISVDVNLVNILFTVADKKGKFVTNLRKDDFRVFEDERTQTITNFSSETDLPLTIALLVDTSGSIRDKLQ